MLITKKFSLTALGGMALVAFLAACSTTQPPADTVASPADTAPVGTPVVDDGQLVSGDNRNLGQVGDEEKFVYAAGHDSVPWRLIASNSGSRSLYIAYVDSIAGRGADCGSHLGVQITETAESVTIASVSSAAIDGTDCAGDAIFGGGEINLAGALGSRILIHAGVSDPWNDVANPIPATPGPTPEPTPKITASYDGSATCENLLDQATLDGLSKSGYVDDSEQFRSAMALQPGQTAFDVLNYGDLLCAWRKPGGTTVGIVYAYGPITADQLAEQKAKLAKLKIFTRSKSANVEYLTYASGGGELAAGTGAGGGYAFGNGYWALSIDNGAGNVLKEIVSNAPKF